MSRISLFTKLWVDPGATRLLLAFAFVLHYALGANVGLSVDEAHYALYATHLALSYFDHPPLVGWVQWPLVAMDAPVAVLRWVPQLLWLGTALLVFQIAELLQRGQLFASAAAAGGALQPSALGAGFWSVMALALAPLLHVLGIGLLPDTLLMFFTALLMWQTLGLMQADAAVSPRRWVALGLVLGLAGLAKYTAIFAALAVALVLLATHGVRLLRSPWPWAAVALAVLMVSPVAIWNAQNGWISLVYQTQHGKGGGWRVLPVVQFLVVQLVAYGPLLLWGHAGWRSLNGTAQRCLVVFFAIPFCVLAVLSGGGSSLPHWAAPAWVALAPLAGLGLSWALQRSAGVLVPWAIVSLGTMQLFLSLVLMFAMASGGVPWLNPGGLGASIAQTDGTPAPVGAERPNPFADLHGWEQAGQRAVALAKDRQLGSVAVQNWTLASRLGWYARPLPVHVLEDRFDQFDFWAGDLPQGGSTLLVDWSQMAYELPTAPHGFAQCTLLQTLPTVHWGFTLSTFRFYDCRNWSGEPKPRLKGER